MKRLNLNYLVAIEINDKEFYMKCDSTKNEESCISQGRIIIDHIAYSKPFVTLRFAGDVSHTEYFDTYDKCIDWAKSFTIENEYVVN
jgi:hypothetical protein